MRRITFAVLVLVAAMNPFQRATAARVVLQKLKQ